MIFGIGVDLANIAEFQRMLADPATHFFAAHFTPGELAYARAQAHGDAARHLAARYAAKEAAIKALDSTRCEVRGARCVHRTSDLEQQSIDYREIEVVSHGDGAPRLAFHGAAEEVFRRAGIRRAHVSLSHEGDMAVAVVVLEK